MVQIISFLFFLNYFIQRVNFRQFFIFFSLLFHCFLSLQLLLFFCFVLLIISFFWVVFLLFFFFFSTKMYLNSSRIRTRIRSIHRTLLHSKPIHQPQRQRSRPITPHIRQRIDKRHISTANSRITDFRKKCHLRDKHAVKCDLKKIKK